jgi:hypothetical protein
MLGSGTPASSPARHPWRSPIEEQGRARREATSEREATGSARRRDRPETLTEIEPAGDARVIREYRAQLQ